MADDNYLNELLGNVQLTDLDLEELDPIVAEEEGLKSMLDDIVAEAKGAERSAGVEPMGGLSEEELLRIEELDAQVFGTPVAQEVSPAEMEVEDEGKKKKKKKEKKAKKEKVPKEKKSKEKKKKESNEDDSKKEKKKLKTIISDFLFEDVDDEEEGSSKKKDENTEILDEMYPEDNRKGKRKKEKQPKEKKAKTKKTQKIKEKKVKEPVNPNDVVQISPARIIVFVTGIVAVILLVIVWTKAFNYYNDMKDAKNYYKEGNYQMAYEIMSGMEVKEKDAKFFQETRQIMVIEKQRNSYFKYTTLGDGIRAFDSLLKGVKVFLTNAESDKKLGVYEETSDIYAEIVTILEEEFGIPEEDAIRYASMENYSQYYEILKIYAKKE